MEPWRDDVTSNQDAWDDACAANMAGWDECWLDITQLDALKRLMLPRFLKAQSIGESTNKLCCNSNAAGCDGVEPDNIDCYSSDECYKVC